MLSDPGPTAALLEAPRPRGRAASLTAAGVALALGGAARAAEPPPGTYRLTAGTTTPTITSWGDDCLAERPEPSTVPPGARYAWTTEGTLQAESRDDPPLFAPGVCARVTGQPGIEERLADPSIFQCTSPGGAAQRVAGTVVLETLAPERLMVRQRFHYSWTLKGSHCDFAVESRFALDRVDPLPPPEVAAAPAAPEAPVVTRPARAVPDFGGKAQALPELAPADPAPAPPPVLAIPVAVVEPAPRGTTWLTAIFAVLGLLAALLAVYIAWRTLITRRRPLVDPAALEEREAHPREPPPTQRPTRSLPPALPAEAGGAGLATETARASTKPPAPVAAPGFAPRRCGHCDRVYDELTEFCPYDGTRLDADGSPEEGDGRRTRARLCPKCGVRQPGSVTRCPRDGTDLLAASGGPTSERGRICPECGGQYGVDATFCGRDGVRLVLLN